MLTSDPIKPIPPTLSQAPEVPAQVPNVFEFKLLRHRLSAGFPSPAADYAEDGLDLNEYLVRHKAATFMFTVKGDSMIGASLEEGDKVVVDRSLRPCHNVSVVAVVEGDFTIKRLYKRRGRSNFAQKTRHTNPRCSKMVPNWRCGVSSSGWFGDTQAGGSHVRFATVCAGGREQFLRLL